jgi:hypothetical protein
MSDRQKIYVVVGLVILAVVVYFANRDTAAGLPGVLAANEKFQPLNIQEPQLRLDLLEKLQKIQYVGTHRNIFSAIKPPPVLTPAELRKIEQARAPVGPAPPPPVEVPGQFFGFVTMSSTGKRLAFFTSGEDVLVVEEGTPFLNRFRLVRIGNDSADVEEISSGRHTTVTIVQAPGGDSQQPQPFQPQPSPPPNQ